MSLGNFFQSVVLPLVSGGTAGWALIRFFGQRLVEHRLAKDLERYREELKESTEVLKCCRRDAQPIIPPDLAHKAAQGR